MSEIFLCQMGQLSTAGKRDLKRAGVVVVEVEDPSTCQFIRSTEMVSGDDMLWAAMDALKRDYGYGDHGAKQRETFALTIASLVATARTARTPSPPIEVKP